MAEKGKVCLREKKRFRGGGGGLRICEYERDQEIQRERVCMRKRGGEGRVNL